MRIRNASLAYPDQRDNILAPTISNKLFFDTSARVHVSRATHGAVTEDLQDLFFVIGGKNQPVDPVIPSNITC